ncbi:unnamed protein product [Phytophthora lilii]|uniref:Unnamed protein product n=1 Tax=Phytophthora lilii TaxID=2077276 RepID=A0A9W6TFB8_9STRA|nr:unnamed protein product [Phytophthora lilii]
MERMSEKRSSARKAAAAAEKKLAFKEYSWLLERDDYLFPKMEAWTVDTTLPTKLLKDMKAAGIEDAKAKDAVMRYVMYGIETAWKRPGKKYNDHLENLRRYMRTGK